MSIVNSSLYRFGEFSLDPQTRTLRRGGDAVPLTPKAFDVLFLLLQNAGTTVTKDQLMKAVWPSSFVEESNLTQTIFMVRKTLDETTDCRYILTVQGQGYRFLAPVTEKADHGLEADAQSVASSAALPDTEIVPDIQLQPHTSPPGNWKFSRSAGFGVALLLIMIAASILWFWGSQLPAAAAPDRIMLAVLPFENFTGDSSEDYFGDGLTEEMISQLGNLDPAHLGVIARTSVMHYKHTQESLLQIGKELGVQYVVEGSVRRDPERVRITAQLIQVKDQTHLWAREYDRDLGHLLELQAEISREVANEIEFSLSGRRPLESARPVAVPPPGAKSYEAYDLYLKGRFCWNKRSGDGFQQAADYFQQAIDKDPNFARAYAGLADTFGLMSTWYVGPQNELMPKARAAALRALQLDDGLAEAHASLALIKENYDYDWPGAEKEFRRAIQLDPQYATAHQWYAEFLSWQGRFPEAFAESERARQLDPLSFIIATDRASIFYESRQYDSALRQWRSALDLDPSYLRAEDLMIPAYLQLGRYDDAVKGIRRWEARGEGSWLWAWKAVAYTKAGHPEEARRALARLEQASELRDRTVALSLAYSGMGEKDRALELLQQMYSQHSNAVVQIKVEPIYDPLRSDPRFVDLLSRLGLEPQKPSNEEWVAGCATSRAFREVAHERSQRVSNSGQKTKNGCLLVARAAKVRRLRRVCWRCR